MWVSALDIPNDERPRSRGSPSFDTVNPACLAFSSADLDVALPYSAFGAARGSTDDALFNRL